jgi:hypothetical protein
LRDRKLDVRTDVERLVASKEKGVNLADHIEQMESLKDQISKFGKDLNDLNFVFKKIFVRFLSYKDNTDVLDNYEGNLNQLLAE